MIFINNNTGVDLSGEAAYIDSLLSDMKNGLISAKEAAQSILNKAEEGEVAGEVSAEEKKAVEWDWDVDNLPEGWTKTENNGRIHVRDAEGNIRSRIDPPDAKTDYQHQHRYDGNGNSLDADGNIVPYNSPDAHIPYGG